MNNQALRNLRTLNIPIINLHFNRKIAFKRMNARNGADSIWRPNFCSAQIFMTSSQKPFHLFSSLPFPSLLVSHSSCTSTTNFLSPSPLPPTVPSSLGNLRSKERDKRNSIDRRLPENNGFFVRPELHATRRILKPSGTSKKWFPCTVTFSASNSAFPCSKIFSASSLWTSCFQ